MKNSRKYNKGFTLIELMIVIAIIAIIISYALPAYRDFGARTKIGEGTAMAAAYKVAVNQAFVENGVLAGLNNSTNGIPGPNALGNCVNRIVVTNGEIVVTFNCAAGTDGFADPNVDVAVLTWTPAATATSTLQWTCSAVVNSPDQDPCPG